MTSLLEIKQTLTYLVEANQQLLELAQQKQSVLIESKVTDLQNIVSKESKLIELVLKLEEKREQEMKEFLLEQKHAQASLTMEQFVQVIVEPEMKLWLTETTKQLRGIVQELSRLNKNNQELISTTMSFINYSINVLMPKETSIGYGKDSKVRSAKLLDAKI